jgi:hypothetical protein
VQQHTDIESGLTTLPETPGIQILFLQKHADKDSEKIKKAGSHAALPFPSILTLIFYSLAFPT